MLAFCTVCVRIICTSPYSGLSSLVSLVYHDIYSGPLFNVGVKDIRPKKLPIRLY